MIKFRKHKISSLERLEKQRQQFIQRSDIPNAIRRWFVSPVASADSVFTALPLVVMDFETTGLDPESDEILSVGLVDINESVLSLSSAKHYYQLSLAGVKPETAVINHIVPETLHGGLETQEFAEKILRAICGKVVVVHCAIIEKRFLARLLQLPQGVELPVIWIDTLVLESSLYVNKLSFLNDYRLCKIREKRQLPAYLAHNALADAVATGELLLVLIQEIFASASEPTLSQLYARSCGYR